MPGKNQLSKYCCADLCHLGYTIKCGSIRSFKHAKVVLLFSKYSIENSTAQKDISVLRKKVQFRYSLIYETLQISTLIKATHELLIKAPYARKGSQFMQFILLKWYTNKIQEENPYIREGS